MGEKSCIWLRKGSEREDVSDLSQEVFYGPLWVFVSSGYCQLTIRKTGVTRDSRSSNTVFHTGSEQIFIFFNKNRRVS